MFSTPSFHLSNLGSGLVDLLSQKISSISSVNVIVSIKLNSNNSLIRREQLESLIITYGLEGFMDPLPFLSFLMVVKLLWILVKSWIYSSVICKMSTRVSRKGTAQTQWKTLEESFDIDSWSRIIDLRSQLQTLTNDGLSVNEYIIKAKTISHHLADIDEPIYKRDLVMYALAGLKINSCY